MFCTDAKGHRVHPPLDQAATLRLRMIDYRGQVRPVHPAVKIAARIANIAFAVMVWMLAVCLLCPQLLDEPDAPNNK